MRSTLWTGRPIRALATPYIRDWEQNRREEINKLQGRGQIVLDYELDRLEREGKLTEEIEDQTTQRYARPKIRLKQYLLTVSRPMGCCAAMVTKINQPAAEIVEEIVQQAYRSLREGALTLDSPPKL